MPSSRCWCWACWPFRSRALSAPCLPSACAGRSVSSKPEWPSSSRPPSPRSANASAVSRRALPGLSRRAKGKRRSGKRRSGMRQSLRRLPSHRRPPLRRSWSCRHRRLHRARSHRFLLIARRRPAASGPVSRSASAPAGWSGSAGWRWRSAASSWCAIRSSRAGSGPACACCSAPCSRRPWSAAGEWLRRGQGPAADSAGIPAANIPSILTAAGTTVAFATVWAAYALYGFLSPAAAFLLLGIVALVTLAAALLHGPALAALGLVGAEVTPLLVASDKPDYWALYIYLAVVTAAAFAHGEPAAVAMARDHRPGVRPVLGPAGIDAGRRRSAASLPRGGRLRPRRAADRRRPAVWTRRRRPAGSTRCRRARSRSIWRRRPSSWSAQDHDAAATVVFALLTAATVAIAWRTEAAAGALPVAAALAALVIIAWAVDPVTSHLVASGPGSGARAGAVAGEHRLAFRAGRGVCGGCSRRRVSWPRGATTSATVPMRVGGDGRAARRSRS